MSVGQVEEVSGHGVREVTPAPVFLGGATNRSSETETGVADVAGSVGTASFYGEIPFGWTNAANRTLLVLAVGNVLLRDDGVGPLMLARLKEEHAEWRDLVDFVDGGTQGLGLLTYLSGRSAVVILDAVALGAAAGTVHVLNENDLNHLRAHRSTTAHEGNAGELMATAKLLGELPEKIAIVGIEPAEIQTGLGLSEAVQRALPDALAAASLAITAFL